MKTIRKRRTSMRRSKKSKPRTRKQKKTAKVFYQRGSGEDGPEVGEFYLLNADANGYRPLYLILQNLDEQQMLAQSCPPVNYPEPRYYIRGRQQDPLPKSILKQEIKFTKMTKNKSSGDRTLKDADGYYQITLPKNWIDEHKDIWEIIKFKNNLRDR